MRAIIFSGSHLRHAYIAQHFAELADEALVFVIQREAVIPVPPDYLTAHDRLLFQRHFQTRKEKEEEAFGESQWGKAFSDFVPLEPQDLNSVETAQRVADFSADICFIFGTPLIREPLFSSLPKDKINLHLGLSPRYRGAATLYFPFVMLQPQFAGITFHQIVDEADAGPIVHQTTPELLSGDGIHDVGTRSVTYAREALPELVRVWKEKGFENARAQKTSGKNWLNRDFEASQLRQIYDVFSDRIVDAYLAGELGSSRPKLVSILSK